MQSVKPNQPPQSEPIHHNPRLMCGLCKEQLSVPPVQHCESKDFICGVCYGAEHYHPQKHEKKLDNVTPQTLYDLYAAPDTFFCMYENCGQYFQFGRESFEHRKNCNHRNFVCPVTPLNKHYVPIYYEECEFKTRNATELFSHVKQKHPELVRNKIDTSEFWRRPHALIVLEIKDVLSVVFVDKIMPHSLEVSCRQYKYDVSDKCVIEVMQEHSKKYVIPCNDSIGPINDGGKKFIRDATKENIPILFSIVAHDAAVPGITVDTKDAHKSQQEEEVEVEEDDDWMVLKDDIEFRKM